MSRHYIKSAERCVAYGYDRILRHYFYSVMVDGESVADDGFGGCCGGEVLDAMAAFGVTLPKEHEAALVLDVPIVDTVFPGGSIDIEHFDDRVAVIRSDLAESEALELEGLQE